LLAQSQAQDPRLTQHRAFVQQWPHMEDTLRAYTRQHTPLPQALAEGLEAAAHDHGPWYTHIVQGLNPQAVTAGQQWLSSIAHNVAAPLQQRVPKLEPF